MSETLSLEGATAMPSKHRLLAAGVDLMTSEPGELLRRAFTAGSVSGAAGLARRTFYDNFPTVDDYVDALLAYVSAVAGGDGEISVCELFAVNDGSLRAVVEALVTQHLDRVGSCAEVRAAFAAELMGMRRAPSERLLPWHGLLENLREFGYQPLPPLESVDVVDAVCVLLDGLAVRASDTASPPPSSWATEAVLGMLISMTAARHAEPGTESLETMSRYVKASWSEQGHDRPVANVRRLVLDAAADEIAERGADRFDLAALSERTGLSASAISRYVGNRRQILEALLDRIYPGLLLALERDLEAGQAPETALLSHLQRFAALTQESPEYAAAELSLRSRLGSGPVSGAGRELMEMTGSLLASTSSSPDTVRPDHLMLGEWAMRVVALGTPEITRSWCSSILVGAMPSAGVRVT